jgi:hypothetical protein
MAASGFAAMKVMVIHPPHQGPECEFADLLLNKQSPFSSMTQSQSMKMMTTMMMMIMMTSRNCFLGY